MADSRPSDSNRNLHHAYVPRTKPPSFFLHNTAKEKYPIINKPKPNTIYGSNATQNRNPLVPFPADTWRPRTPQTHFLFFILLNLQTLSSSISKQPYIQIISLKTLFTFLTNKLFKYWNSSLVISWVNVAMENGFFDVMRLSLRKVHIHCTHPVWPYHFICFYFT